MPLTTMSTVMVDVEFWVRTVGNGSSPPPGTPAAGDSVAVGVVAVGSASPLVAVWVGAESMDVEETVTP